MEELSIQEIQDKMGRGELTARGLVEGYLNRIEAIDKAGPAINAVIELNPEALDIAAALDEESRMGRPRGPLHGVPILLKDNIATGDRMRTTAGSLALEGSLAPEDAFIVARLRAAGAVILGKTNLSEWANFRGKRSTSGWSSRGGLTRNPYALDRTACGSSSGSAAAVAADLCAAAVGTETDGSIVCPAQTCGVVGLKPTLGLLSRRGIIPIAHSQDTAGPMARGVADAAILLAAMAGFDASDPAMRPVAGERPVDYLGFLDPDGLRGARLGVARSLAGSNPRVLEIFESCLETLRKAGANLVDPVELPHPRKLGRNELEVLHGEFKADLEAYLASLGPEAPVRTMADIIKFNEDNRAKVMPYFGQEHLIAAEKSSMESWSYRRALAANLRLARRKGIDRCLKRHRLDAIVLPSGEPAWMIDLVNGDASNADVESSSLPAIAGYPHITVPAGHLFGLPVGLSFFSTAWSEPTLIKVAYAFERARQARRPPRFSAQAEVDWRG